MTRTIAVANQKGGVGKTTTSVNLSASLQKTGARTLLVDMDPQGNATTGCGVDKHQLEYSNYHWLLGEASLEDTWRQSSAGFRLIPANTDLTAAEVALLQVDDRSHRLSHQLAAVEAGLDYIIIDCPPTLTLLTLNALFAADGVLIPMQCEYYALEGLTDLLETVEGVRSNGNSKLEIEGILRTMYDPRNSLTGDVSKQLIEHFGEQVFRTVIPRNVRLAEAPSHGLPAMLYDSYSRGAVAYHALAAEVIRRRAQKDASPDG